MYGIHLITEGLFTSGHFMCLLWLDSYPIVKRPGVNAFQNTFETDFNSRWNCRIVNAFSCWNYICKFYSSQNIKITRKSVL